MLYLENGCEKFPRQLCSVETKWYNLTTTRNPTLRTYLVNCLRGHHFSRIESSKSICYFFEFHVIAQDPNANTLSDVCTFSLLQCASPIVVKVTNWWKISNFFIPEIEVKCYRDIAHNSFFATPKLCMDGLLIYIYI